MQFLLDHIAALLVASLLFLSMVTVMHRNRQNAVEIQVSQMIQEQAYDFARVVEKDLENIRSEQEVLDVIGTHECYSQLDRHGNTRVISFPSLKSPNLGSLSNIVNIEYRLRTDSSLVRVDTTDFLVYRVERWIKEGSSVTQDGGSGDYITRFLVSMYDQSQPEIAAHNLSCPEFLSRIHLEFEAAIPTVERVSARQRSTAGLNITRYGATIYTQNR